MKNTSLVPTLAEASPIYADAVNRQHDMQAKLTTAQNESAALHARLDTKPVTLGESDKAVRVAALLGGSDEPGLERARLFELDRTIDDFKSALSIATGRVAQARAAASATICKQVEPHHRRLASIICTRLVELHAAVAEYVALADALNGNDVVWQNLIPAHPNFLGRANDKYGPIADYLREAVRHGNFLAKDVPVSLS